MNAVAKVEQPSSAVVIGASSMLEIISRAASDPNTDVAKLERLMAMAERVQDREAKQAFGIAMKQAQDEMGPVRADASNPQTKSRYATYGALDKAIRPIYTRNGFALTFDTGEGAPTDHLRLVCDVFHDGGHSRQYHIDMPADGKGAKGGDVMTKTHASGSAATYGQRYLLKLIFNIVVGDDDDGNSAGGNGPITEDQLEKVTDLLVRFDADVPAFCKYMGVKAVKDIPVSKYRKAIESLNLKGKQQK